MTQDELAVHMGKSSKQTISSWENDKNEPTLSDFKKLAQLFDTTVSYLIGEDQEDQQTGQQSSEYISISKDELIDLLRKANKNQDEEIKDLQQQLERTKNH